MSTDIGKETQRVRAAREWACSQMQGEVLELAVGTGRNLPLYPEVLRATAVELSPEMLALARARAAELGVEVDLRLGDAQALEFEDARFDTVLITLPSGAGARPQVIVLPRTSQHLNVR